MTDLSQNLRPDTARQVFLRQMVFFAVLLAMNDVVNALSTITELGRGGVPVAHWKPVVWEFTSGLVLWLLIPLLHYWLKLFPLARSGWWRNLPAHLLITVPFSLVHVGCMVLLRKAVYAILGGSYHFGPWWPNWRYEFNKDFATYWVLLALLMAFRIYGLWLDSHSTGKQIDTPLKRLLVRKLNREFILNVMDVDRIEAAGNYVTLYTRGETYPLRESLASLEEKLDREHFARVHRSHIVNIDRIREVQPWDHGDYRILMEDGCFINFSRRYRKHLNHLFQ